MLPVAAAAVRSIGVLTRNKGDLDDGDDVSNRAICADGGLATVVETDDANGSGSVWDSSNEMDDRISITEEAAKLAAPEDVRLPSI